MVPPTCLDFSTRLVVHAIASGLVMSSNDHKIFNKFIWFSPPKFSGAISKDD